MAEPIPLDVARKRKRGDDPPAEQQEQCPVVALGHRDGKFYFLDTAGEKRCLAARSLGSRSELQALFMGNTTWLRERFTQRKTVKDTVAGETVVTHTEVGFNASDAAEYLMREAAAAGIYGDHIVIRQPGIWRGAEGAPVVHCGSDLWMDGAWRRAGARIGDTVWVSGPPVRKPDKPCGPEIGLYLAREIARLWTFKHSGSNMICVGLMATAMLGAAPHHRPSGFLRAEAGSGKSLLLDALRACAPMHYYTNDTTAAGVTGAMNGRAMPIYIDEPTDRVDQVGALKLMDLVLASAGGEGVKGSRGNVDGTHRTIEMVGAFLYAATSPPELQPQHMRRITMVDLVAPAAGTDHRIPMEDLASDMRAESHRIWARVIQSWQRWKMAATAYREALAAIGCAGGEIDQMSAILAGWWIMTEDGEPSPRDARIGVASIRDFVRVADDVAADSNPRRAVAVLLAALVQYDGTTRREQVGTLLSRIWQQYDVNGSFHDATAAAECLGRHGIRAICARDVTDKQNRPVPRLADGDGLWLAPASARALFKDSPFEGDRWRTELLRLPGAKASRFNVRIGGGQPGKSVWLSREDVDPAVPVSAHEVCLALKLSMPQLLGLISRYRSRFPVAQEHGGDVEKGWLFDLGKVAAFVDRVREAEKPP